MIVYRMYAKHDCLTSYNKNDKDKTTYASVMFTTQEVAESYKQRFINKIREVQQFDMNMEVDVYIEPVEVIDTKFAE